MMKDKIIVDAKSLKKLIEDMYDIGYSDGTSGRPMDSEFLTKAFDVINKKVGVPN